MYFLLQGDMLYFRALFSHGSNPVTVHFEIYEEWKLHCSFCSKNSLFLFLPFLSLSSHRRELLDVSTVYAIFLLAFLVMGTYNILPGVACLAIGSFCLYRTLTCLRRWQFTLGTITNFDLDDTPKYWIAFFTRTGRHVRVETTWGEKQRGAKILLLYDPEKPETKVKKCAFTSLWRSTIIWVWVGWVLVYNGMNYEGWWNAYPANVVSGFIFPILMWIAPLLLILIVGPTLFHFYRNYRVRMTQVAYRV